MLDEIWQTITSCLSDSAACADRLRPYWGYGAAAALLLLAWLALGSVRRAKRRRAEQRLLDMQRQQLQRQAAAPPGRDDTTSRDLHRALVAIHIEIDLLLTRLTRAAADLGDLAKSGPDKLIERFRGAAPEWMVDTRIAYMAGIEAIAAADAQVPATIGAFYDLIGIWNARVRAFAAGIHGLNPEILARLANTNQRLRAVGESARILIERYLEDEELPPLPKWVDLRFSDQEHARIKRRSGGLDIDAP